MKQLLYILIATFLLGVLAPGCDRDEDLRPVPPDTDPGIALLSPDRASILARFGESLEFSLLLTDNQGLRLLRLVESFYDPEGEVIFENVYRDDIALNGSQNETITYRYVVPGSSQGQALPLYTRIRLMFYAIDSKGAAAELPIFVDVVADPGDPAPYQIYTYKDLEITHPNSLDGRNNWSFSAVSPVSNPLNQDIEIVDTRPGPWTSKSIVSPNNDQLGRAQVFAQVNEDALNYDAADYGAIYRAFYSATEYFEEIAMPQPNEMFIVRLAEGNGDRFALVRINEYTQPNSGLVKFEYKYTAP